jgi:hypothetical protein
MEYDMPEVEEPNAELAPWLEEEYDMASTGSRSEARTGGGGGREERLPAVWSACLVCGRGGEVM